jgi:hypothetical protein
MNEQHDDFLHAYREEPAADFAASLRAQLGEAGQPAPRSLASWVRDRLIPGRGGAAPRQGAWKLRLAATAAILALLFTVTPLRALATDILYQLGVITYTNDPTMAEILTSGVTPTPPPTDIPGKVIELDGVRVYQIPVISRLVGYPVYAPQHVPIGAELYDRETSKVAAGEYLAISAYRLVGGDFLYIEQTHVGFNIRGERIGVGSASVQPETVGANPAVWVEGIATNNAGATLQRSNMLMWDADGYTFTLQSASLDRAEMKAIAASMAPGE